MNLSEFMGMSEKERHSSAVESMWRVVEACVTEIARARRSAKLMHDISNEEFDEKLNDLCEKANSKYVDMDQHGMMIDMITELVSSK